MYGHRLNVLGQYGFAQGLVGLCQFFLNCGFDLLLGHSHSAGRCVYAFAHVNPNLFDVAGHHSLNIFRVFEHKTGAPKGMLHPRATELFEVHPRGKLLNADLLEHEARCLF